MWIVACATVWHTTQPAWPLASFGDLKTCWGNEDEDSVKYATSHGVQHSPTIDYFILFRFGGHRAKNIMLHRSLTTSKILHRKAQLSPAWSQHVQSQDLFRLCPLDWNLRSAARHEYENGFRCHLSVMKGPNIFRFWKAMLLEANKTRSLTSPNFTTSSIIWSKACGTLWKQKSLKRNEKQQWIIHCIFTLGPHVYPVIVISSDYLSSQTSWCSMWLLWLSI